MQNLSITTDLEENKYGVFHTASTMIASQTITGIARSPELAMAFLHDKIAAFYRQEKARNRGK